MFKPNNILTLIIINNEFYKLGLTKFGEYTKPSPS